MLITCELNPWYGVIRVTSIYELIVPTKCNRSYKMLCRKRSSMMKPVLTANQAC